MSSNTISQTKRYQSTNRRPHCHGERRFTAGQKAANQGAAKQHVVVAPVVPQKTAKQVRCEETLKEVTLALHESSTVRIRQLKKQGDAVKYVVGYVTLAQLQARPVTKEVQHELKAARFLDITKDAPTHAVHAQNELPTDDGERGVYAYDLASVRRLKCQCGCVTVVPRDDEVPEIVRRLLSLRAAGVNDNGDRYNTGVTSAESIAIGAACKLRAVLPKDDAEKGKCQCHLTKVVAPVVVAKAKATVTAIDVARPLVWADEMDELEGNEEAVLNMDFSLPLYTSSPRA